MCVLVKIKITNVHPSCLVRAVFNKPNFTLLKINIFHAFLVGKKKKRTKYGAVTINATIALCRTLASKLRNNIGAIYFDAQQ